MCVEKLLDSPDEVALELVLAGKPLRFYPGLAPGTDPPARFRTLITPYVYKLTGEEIHDFRQYILEELERPVVPRTIDVLEHAPFCLDFKRTPGAGEFGIRGNGGCRMPRHFDFGDDCHEPLARVGHNLADFILRIEPAVGLAVPQRLLPP